MDRFERLIITSSILSILSGSYIIALLKSFLFLTRFLHLPSIWLIYIFHILTSSSSPTISEQTSICLVLFSFPTSPSASSQLTQHLSQLLLWLLFAGFFTADLLQILPALVSVLILYFQSHLSLQQGQQDLDLHTFSEENKQYREKIEAHSKISTQLHGLSTSRRTSMLINKLKRIKTRAPGPVSFTEGSDNDSHGSDVDFDTSSKHSANKDYSSSSVKESSSMASSEIAGIQGITNDDIKEIITNLINQEYLMWNPEKCKDSEVDFMSIAVDAKNVYTQSIESLPGSSHRVIKIPKVKVKRIQSIRSMIEESDLLGEVLEGIGEWDFDCFKLIQITKDPAFEVGLYVFTVLGLSDTFQIPNQVLRNFLTAVEHGYNRLNFYHNSIHASDVTASTVFLIQKGLSRCGNLVDLDVFSLVTAAICHDIGHPGVNNSFLVATGNELAMKYNDQSCLENMHCNKTFTILANDNCNITKTLIKADFQKFRKNIVSAILATDLQVHFDKLHEFRSNLEKKLDMSDDKFRMMAIQMCLKCADIGHGARKLEIHKNWTSLITKEFFRQGELEAQAGIAVSPLCDRHNCVLSKSQVGFLEVLVKPLFKVWEEFVELNNEEETELEVKVCLQNVMENIEFWDNEFHLVQLGTPEFVLDTLPPPLGN